MTLVLIPRILAIVGPTAVGKTAVSLEVARRLDAEIISCDSMQVYRHMPVLSQAPALEQRAQVPHHLIDCVEPTENFSAGQYRTLARTAIQDVLNRGKRALIVGGTGLYLKALSAGMCEAPPCDHEVRKRLWLECESRGAAVLYERLLGIDRAAAAKIHPNDAKRIIRAIEVFVVSGRSLSNWWTDSQESTQPLPIAVIGLARERQELCARIAERQLDMIFEQDVIAEARAVLSLSLSLTARQVHGLPDIEQHLQRKISLKEMIAVWQARVRQYAKRQMTWFRHIEGIRWVHSAAEETSETTAARALELAEKMQAEPVHTATWSN